MTAVQDGQLIEGVLYLLDNNPIINPTFNSPAISTIHLAGSLGFNPSLINPRQICQAIAPLAETLFPTPRIPVFRTHLNEGWIVFEESSLLNVKPLKLAKRTTLTSYSTSRRRLSVEITPGREGALPSAPLRQTSSGELVANLPDPRDPPNSARIEVSKGKKSFLRPFLLGGRRKKGEMPAAAMHKSKREGGSEVHAIEKMVDDHFEVPDSPQETIASNPRHDSDGDDHGSGEASPVWAPLGKGKKGVSKRGAEMRIVEGAPSSTGVATPNTPIIPLTPITPSTPVSPPMVNSPTPSPIPTPTTALIELTPLEASRRFTPVPITPITPSLASTIPSSPIISTSSSPIPTVPITTTTKSSSRREPGHDRDRDHHHHHRKPNETSGERNKRKAREQARREDGSEGSRSRASQSEDVEEEDTWLEGIFEDLPFGPDKNMSRAIESIKRDYKIFIAETIALVGVACVIQRSGW